MTALRAARLTMPPPEAARRSRRLWRSRSRGAEASRAPPSGAQSSARQVPAGRSGRRPRLPQERRRSDLPHRLRLPGQLLEVVRVAHQALSRPHAVAAVLLVAAGEDDVAGADEGVDLEALPARGNRVGRTAQLHRRLARRPHDLELPCLEAVRRQLSQCLLLLLPPGALTVCRVDRSQHLACDLLQSAPLGHRTHVRQTDSLAARLHAALVVPLARAGEARLEQVVAHQRLEPSRQLTLAAHPATHRGTQIVIDQAQRHAAEVRERSHVAVEECHLVAPVVQPHQRTARVRQVQQKLPHPVRHAVLLDRYLEEVHLATLAGTVHQRYERLLPLTLPLPYVAAHRRDPDLVAILQQLPMKARSSQTAASPSSGETICSATPPDAAPPAPSPTAAGACAPPAPARSDPCTCAPCCGSHRAPGPPSVGSDPPPAPGAE